MEIGCNDGIFLQNFKNFDHLGVEPSKNVYKISKSKKLKVLNYFFNEELIAKKKLNNKFDVIFANKSVIALIKIVGNQTTLIQSINSITDLKSREPMSDNN